MGGAIGAAYYLVNLPEVGGMQALLTHENVVDKISILPNFGNREALITLLIIPLAVQWWSSWYPGAEPGGGGYIAQRMLAAKDENHAIGATFFFNIMHYALRPWPWILVALASLVVFPDLESIQAAFPKITADKLGHDLAYPAMLTKLPTGLLGLVLASLISAYMSTISTQLNWGSSYIVYDFYKRQINPEASQKRLVAVGRLSTVLLMVLSTLLALLLQNAMQLFNLLLVFGAGTGLIFILRWFWWRINAWSEIAAMVVSGLISLLLAIPSFGIKEALFGIEGVFPPWAEFPFVVFVTTSIWLLTTYFTPSESKEVLRSFYTKIQPGGPGWKKVIDDAQKDEIDLTKGEKGWTVPSGIVAMLLGCLLIYSIMFATGYFIYGDYQFAFPLFGIALVSAFFLVKTWKKIRVRIL
jgi:Na+/proline symporter